MEVLVPRSPRAMRTRMLYYICGFIGLLLVAITLSFSATGHLLMGSVTSLDNIVEAYQSRAILPNAFVTVPVIGDWGRGGNMDQIMLVPSLSAWSKHFSPDIVVSVGDNFYTFGVQGINDTQWAQTWEGVYNRDSALSRLTWFSILGNHDYRGDIHAQTQYHSVNPRWQMPFYNYSRIITRSGAQAPEYGIETDECVRAVFIDTTPLLSEYIAQPENEQMAANIKASNKEAQYSWIEDQVSAATRCPATIVFGHQPIWSGGEHGDAQDLKQQLLPIISGKSADGKRRSHAYISGHDHVLMHLEHRQQDGEIITQIVSGAGSSVRHNNHNTPELQWIGEQTGFSLHSVNKTHILHSFIGINGTILYSVLRELV